MALAGDLKEITFSDVVQLCAQARRTAMLVVNCPKTGKALGFFYFEQGELFDAKYEDAIGLEAVYRALEIKDGTFHVVLDVRSPERRIFEPIGAMLLEGMRRMDEAGQLTDSSNGDGGDLMRHSLPDSDEATEGDDMASADLRGRVCPTCRKQYTHGEICPDDGARLIVAAATSHGLESLPPARTVPPPTALASRPARPRGPMIAVAAGVGALVVLGGVFLFRGSGGGTPSTPGPRASTAANEPAPTPTAVPSPVPAPPPPARPAAAVVQTPPAEPPTKEPPPAAPATGVRGVTDKEIVFGQAAAFTGASKEL